MKKIISFSIWGTDEKYYRGAINNIFLKPVIYPEWNIRFYISDDVSISWENKFLNMGAEVVRIKAPYKGDWEGLYWRFFPASDSSIERFISRDTDSILNVREKAAVDEWIKSGKDFHIMRDHDQHGVPILGGMWGCVGGAFPSLITDVYKVAHFDRKGVDQEFLRDYVWPHIQGRHLSHDEIFSSRFPDTVPFPKHDKLPLESPYVGCIYEDAVEIIRNGGIPK